MKLRRVHGFQKIYDLEVKRNGSKITLTVTCEGIQVFDKTIPNGSTQMIKL